MVEGDRLRMTVTTSGTLEMDVRASKELIPGG